MLKNELYVVMDGDFTLKNGVPSSNRNHYDIFAKRYAEVFPRVKIMCRVHEREDLDSRPIGGERVEVVALPPVHGVLGLLKHGLSTVRAFWRVPRDAAIILRVPGIYPALASFVFSLRSVPFAVEAMADADAQFAPGAYRGKMRVFYRVVWRAIMKWQCSSALASSYVTRESLQVSYPPKADRFTTHYTTLDLPADAIAVNPRTKDSFRGRRLRLINVAMMQKHLKGQDVILKALALVRNSVDIELILVGDGETRAEFEALGRALKVDDIVKFVGRVNAGLEVFELLDRSDVFVLPSRQEGLPRVLIEAMARGMPCVASNLPGCEELLEPEFLVKNNEPTHWADLLVKLLPDCEKLASQSAENIARASEYRIDLVTKRREKFYRHLMEG